MFTDMHQIKSYIASNEILSLTRFPEENKWVLSIDTPKKRRFVQEPFASKLLADPIVSGIPIKFGRWPMS